MHRIVSQNLLWVPRYEALEGVAFLGNRQLSTVSNDVTVGELRLSWMINVIERIRATMMSDRVFHVVRLV